MEKRMITRNDLVKVEEFLYEIPKSFRADMRVPARLFLSDDMIDSVLGDRSLEQLVNVATLPGIKNFAFAMPDIHQGYGFPIGGLAATAVHEGGVISPGGIGYDINCGVRLLITNMTVSEIKDIVKRNHLILSSEDGKGLMIMNKDGETLAVSLLKGKCCGIQRLRN